MSYHDMNGVVLKYLEDNGYATLEELYKQCDVYDWTWSMVDMESLIADMICDKQIKSFALFINEALAFGVYVPYSVPVELVQMNVVK